MTGRGELSQQCKQGVSKRPVFRAHYFKDHLAHNDEPFKMLGFTNYGSERKNISKIYLAGLF